MALDSDLRLAALHEVENRPLLRLFLKCFAKRVKAEAGIPNQSWKDKFLKAMAFAFYDLDRELSDCEDS